MGSYSGGDYDSSDDDGSQDEGSTDDQTQTGVDDYTGDDGDDDSGEDSGGGKAAAAGAAGAAGTAGAGGAGAAGTAASGAGGGAVTEPPEGDDSGDTGEPEEEECEDEEEEQPEPQDVEEPDIEPEDDIDDPETEEDAEEEDTDEEEEEDETVVVVQEVDALSAMSWGVQPVMKHVEECYGEEIELFYKPVPVREIDPEQAKQKWVEYSEELDVPIDPSFWEEDPPESTELVNKAFEAAIQQYRGMEYIRTLWRRGVAAGRDINDRQVLVNLASELGLDRERFEEDLDEAELETGERDELPFTFMEIHGAPAPKTGRVRYTDFKTQFTFQGIEEQKPQELQGFVDEHGPVASPEVMEVYGIQRREAIQRLEDLDGVSSFEVSGERFWY